MQTKEEIRESLKQHMEYRDLLKGNLSRAGINYAETQKRLRQVRCIIVDLTEKLWGMTLQEMAKRDAALIDAGESQEFERCGIV